MTIKIFDILNFDMINHIKLSVPPVSVCYLKKSGVDLQIIAVSNNQNGDILLYEDDPEPKNEPLVVKVHNSPVKIIKFNVKFGVVISSDINGYIEYWDPNSLDMPKDKIDFKSKFGTDLFE